MLKREISRWDLILLFINGTIGAGIFGLPSQVYGLAGFYSLPALFICAIIIFILILAFAEVASRFNKTGGPYLYTLAAFGKKPAFVIGWLLLITRVSAYAALIHLLVTYLGYFHPVLVTPFYYEGLIILITLLFTWINYLGVRNSTILNNTLAIAKILPLLIFVVAGAFFIDMDLVNTGQAMPPGSNFASSVLILIFAFTGFESVLVNTGEVKNPKKNIPFALIVSLTFVTIFYALILFVNMGTLPELASSNTPITDAARLFLGPAGAFMITLGAVISIGGTLNAVMLIGSRVPYALAGEKQFPKLFQKVHPRNHTPVYSLFLFIAISIVASLTGSFIYAVSITVISKVLIYLLVCAALIKMRRKSKKEERYFKLKYGYFIAITGMLASIGLLISADLSEFLDVLITVLAGILLFGIYKYFSATRKK
ncbi:amino acid permease [Antarcticibacterium flavum]|uniref:Amino acid permease n=1 Tax=Antarcticibacterium flavum TaxID=2058175 RepID=A0A5B7WYL9_9FLAO|nr:MULTISPECIES: APC family permease [Antarcticibacterium]MCM4158901.1 amino acid transporter [Antarcticibacterium sp. W02-3]QCY68157.1 amino acid permease [Antarcticibacterium flavum]